MQKLKLYIIDYEGPDPAKMLEEALGTIFPAGLPAGAAVVVANEPVEEPTDLEPVDEPTAIEEPPPVASPPPPPPEPRRHTGGRIVSREELERTVAVLNACDANRKRAKGELGISLNALYRRLDLAKEAGLDVPAPVRGNPKHREGRQVEESCTSEERPAVIVPPRPRRGRPPSRAQEPGSIADMVSDRGPVAAAVDAIASELIVMEPQSPAMLAKRTSFRPAIVAEALRDDRFRKTTGGYALVPLKR